MQIPASVTSLTTDSRKVTAGTLFCAVKGVNQDGAEYISQAIAQGAVAVLSRKEVVVPERVVHLAVDNDRLAVAKIAAQFYQPQPQYTVAVTGTDGKTSTADFFRQLMELCGKKAASLGTLGLKSNTMTVDAPALNTSPDPIVLHETLQQVAQQGGEYVSLEASSHGLHQYRMHGLNLSAAAFTNLGRDHLDYHQTIDEYFAAKMILFTELLGEGKTAVIFADDPRAKEVEAICKSRNHRVIRYGLQGDIVVRSMQPLATGMAVTLEVFGKLYETQLAMIGDFQLLNICAALGLAIGCGFTPEQLMPHLPQLRSVRGRLELAGKTKEGAAMYVDYAHTPAALEKALNVMRKHCQNKLAVVFGCGGDRDKGKRPEMGKVSCTLADRVYVADDNPRSEVPETIRAEVMAGCNAKAKNIGDRALAVATAVAELEAGDILLIAGKGHETYQLVGNEVLHFDDVEEVQKIVGKHG